MDGGAEAPAPRSLPGDQAMTTSLEAKRVVRATTNMRFELLVDAVRELKRHLSKVRYYDSTGRPLDYQSSLGELWGQLYLVDRDRNPENF